MPKPEVINPGGQLITEIEAQLFLAIKTKPLWAKQIDAPQEVVSLEGRERVEAGDYLCRGIQDEQWPQKAKKLLSTYIATSEKDDAGWQRFDPKPNAAPVQAAQAGPTRSGRRAAKHALSRPSSTMSTTTTATR